MTDRDIFAPNTIAPPRSLGNRLQALVSLLFKAGRRLTIQRRKNTMRLCETLPLGDKRFLAVVLVEQQKFLVGGAGNSVALLAELRAGKNRAAIDQEVHLL
jgi:flagellar biogenesis protein FliO